MDQEYIRCAQCGHDFPVRLVRGRGHIVCGCGMYIEGPEPAKSAISGLTLLLLAMAVVLLTALATLFRRLSG